MKKQPSHSRQSTQTGLLTALSLLVIFFLVQSQSLTAALPNIFGGIGALFSGQASSMASSDSSSLAPCERIEKLFPRDRFGEWQEMFDSNVSKIVDAYLTEPPRIVCGGAGAVTQPPGDLRELAAELPPWKDPDALESLTSDDTPKVLGEYLRVYECSLITRQLVSYHQSFLDGQSAAAGSGTATSPASLQPSDTSSPEGRANMSDITIRDWTTGDQITNELIAARSALQRTLTVLTATTRLRPLSRNLECLERTSLDIRNLLSLAADVSACLPRIWNARGALRTLSP